MMEAKLGNELKEEANSHSGHMSKKNFLPNSRSYGRRDLKSSITGFAIDNYLTARDWKQITCAHSNTYVTRDTLLVVNVEREFQ